MHYCSILCNDNKKICILFLILQYKQTNCFLGLGCDWKFSFCLFNCIVSSVLIFVSVMSQQTYYYECSQRAFIKCFSLAHVIIPDNGSLFMGLTKLKNLYLLLERLMQPPGLGPAEPLGIVFPWCLRDLRGASIWPPLMSRGVMISWLLRKFQFWYFRHS